MTGTLITRAPPWVHAALRYRAWLLVGMVILLAVGIRVRLRDMPLERDEGEYAYAGQLMLQGVPPYKLAYNMKLPGTYAAYALSMLLFGQSASGIRIGLALVNAASIALMFLVGRRLMDETAGVTAAAVFGLMSLSHSVLGLAAHATHFVVAAALGGVLLLLRAASARRPKTIVASGLLFGLAFLMKQHGIFFGIFAVIYLAWTGLMRKPRRWPQLATELGWLSLGCAIPYLLMCVVLAWAGVFSRFVFWTFTYASKYVSSVPMGEGPVFLRATLPGVFWSNAFFWILPGLALVMMWWDERLSGKRLFLTLFLLCSIMALSAGFYFREHYFILLLPALALLTGVAVSRGIYLLKHDKTIELFLAVPILLLFLVGLGAAVVGSGSIWFEESPERASEKVYCTSLFSASAKAAEYIRAHTASDARIAVIGSEPEIYFYSRRHSVTGYIYTYPLMEVHEHALKMQEEMIQDIETARPAYVVFVNDDLSWLGRGDSERKIFRWWDSYWGAHYDIEQSINISETVDPQAGSPTPGKYLLVLKRKA